MKPNNHPQKGDRIAVDPIRNLDDIKAISKILSDSPRDHLLFTMGINNGLRATDLLKLKVKDVKRLKAGESITIRESKTGKTNILMVNKTISKSLQNFLSRTTATDDDFLFKSRKGNGPLQSQAVSKMVKAWTRAINLQGNFGAHTLRKTWGYHQYYTFKTDLSSLMAAFNHATQKQTAEYLDLQLNEAENLFANTL